MMIRRLPVATIALVVLNLALLGALGVKLLQGSQREALLAAVVPPSSGAALQFNLPNPPLNIESLQSQAVFYKARSFYIAPPVAVVEQPPPDYRITGAMSLPNRPLAAMLIHNQTGTRIKVTVGDQLDGWTVAEVAPRRVVVQLGSRSAQIGSTASPGITVVSGGQAAITSPPSSGIIRVPAGSGVTRPAIAQPAPSEAASEAPRLYRPPSG